MRNALPVLKESEGNPYLKRRLEKYVSRVKSPPRTFKISSQGSPDAQIIRWQTGGGTKANFKILILPAYSFSTPKAQFPPRFLCDGTSFLLQSACRRSLPPGRVNVKISPPTDLFGGVLPLQYSSFHFWLM